MLTFLTWMGSIFATLLTITFLNCIIYKRNNRFRTPALAGVLICYIYFSLTLPAIAYVATAQWIGYGWAAALHIAFWIIPWSGEVTFKIPLRWAFESAVDFDRVILNGHGVMTSLPLAWAGRRVYFWAVGENAKEVLNGVVKQIKEQLREQVKNPWTRWKMLHWRWYAPLTGGWSTTREIGDVIDHGVHNTNGFPISRFGSGQGPLGNVTITEVNM